MVPGPTVVDVLSTILYIIRLLTYLPTYIPRDVDFVFTYVPVTCTNRCRTRCRARTNARSARRTCRRVDLFFPSRGCSRPGGGEKQRCSGRGKGEPSGRACNKTTAAVFAHASV